MTQKRKNSAKTDCNTVSSEGGRKDIKRLKRIARKMVEQLEEAIEQCGTTSKDLTQCQNNDSLFTGKSSLIAALITLTDLLLRLEATGSHGEEPDREAELDNLSLSKADRELLKQFVEKQHAVNS